MKVLNNTSELIKNTPKTRFTEVNRKAVAASTNTYKQNVVILQKILTSKKWSKEIRDFRKQESVNSSPEKLRELVEKILSESSLSTKLFGFYVSWYILHNKFDAPSYNFLIEKRKKSIVVEFFRKPNSHDWIALKLMVNLDFENYKDGISARIDARHFKTIGRRVIASKRGNPADRADEIWPDGDLSQDTKRINLVKKDRQRARKIDEKLGVTDS